MVTKDHGPTPAQEKQNHYGEHDVSLIQPYGGKLVNLLVNDAERDELWHSAVNLPRLQLTARNVCDLELLATGAFSPIDRFLDKAEYVSVIEEMRLLSGALFPIPLTLSVKP